MYLILALVSRTVSGTQRAWTCKLIFVGPFTGWQSKGRRKHSLLRPRSAHFLPASRQVPEDARWSCEGKILLRCKGIDYICSHHWGETRTNGSPVFLFTKYLTSLDSIWVLWLSIEVEIELMPNRAGPISRGSLRCRVGSERRQKPAVHSNALGDIIIKPVKTPTGLRVRKSYHVAFHMGTRCP